MNNKYTNTVKAAAYSLGVDVDILNQSLEQMRRASELRKELKHDIDTQYFSIQVQVKPHKENEQR